ncbi:PadR family transcriptional regulator [Floricoccus penangensis]|uniref:PadR family transcriptional regulator n=1 Tax=Floricoccus penangensis TaxID=1859475 RepID=UPI00203EECEF|nr:PadR family transcriptional regulator [Floricoccus penangensis]URZ86550.1 PadR family transcriptional regulator [Floricoccus penangensis]
MTKKDNINIPLNYSSYLIMLCLRHQSHGYEIMKYVEEATNGLITIGPATMYRTISDLEKNGYIYLASEVGTRKEYALTEKGWKLVEEQANFMEMLHNIAKNDVEDTTSVGNENENIEEKKDLEMKNFNKKLFNVNLKVSNQESAPDFSKLDDLGQWVLVTTGNKGRTYYYQFKTPLDADTLKEEISERLSIKPDDLSTGSWTNLYRSRELWSGDPKTPWIDEQ